VIFEAKERAELQCLPLMVTFQDEARFGRINNPKRCWAPHRIRPDVGKQIVREYTYLYGSFSPLDGVCGMMILPYMTTAVMNIFLKEVSERHVDKFILMICDGAPCHSETALDVPSNVMIEHLPPYCPQINPAENMWDEIREKFFPNLVFDSMDAVEEKLVEAAMYYENNPTKVESITGFDWIVSDLLIAN
jgi:hypothetical protein